MNMGSQETWILVLILHGLVLCHWAAQPLCLYLLNGTLVISAFLLRARFVCELIVILSVQVPIK